ncbi:hypothetical protein [Clostridium aminobutyricum]|uniref:Uncharacterized protein n=1 Tax=Clostridium aminobutyricum TaxID=33953 RepID=A0A939IIK1_CLOAM|nr:hypothetical protein [Clostridium aminobutyricum]MBN7773156.1 hypothetical protein [Clostridium aminobutyricum]
MATNTTNYNLVKPTDDEFAEISVINANMDIIDTSLTALEEEKEAILKSATEKLTLVDADALPMIDSVDSGRTKKLSFSNLKALLKTIFATTEDVSELNIFLSKSINQKDSDSTTLMFNCTFEQSTSKWKAVDNTKPVLLLMLLSTGSFSIYKSTAIDAEGYVTAWDSGQIPKKADVLPLIGGTLSGNIIISRDSPAISFKNGDNTKMFARIAKDATSDFSNDYGTSLRDYDIDGKQCQLVVRSNLDITNQLIFNTDKPTYRSYKVFGEHNITVSTSTPSSALAEGAQHQVYA